MRRAAQRAQLMKPCADLLAALVGHVSILLHQHVFGSGATHFAQLVKPCADSLAALVGHVAIFLDERVFGHVAQLVVPCADHGRNTEMVILQCFAARVGF